jgi:uncharacterized membrane protein YgcG
MTGQVHTKFSVIIYTTPDASIANIDAVPDASTVAGASSSADQVVLPLTGTEAATTAVDNVLNYGTSLQDAVSSQSGFSADPTTTSTSSSGGTQTTTTQSTPPSSSSPSPPSSGGGGSYGGGY